MRYLYCVFPIGNPKSLTDQSTGCLPYHYILHKHSSAHPPSSYIRLDPRGNTPDSLRVTGMIERGQKWKHQKIPMASNKTPKIPALKINPQKSHAEFPSLKNFQKALNDIICCALFGCTLFAVLRGRDTRLHYQESSNCFEYPKNPYLNQAIQKIIAKFSCPQKSRNRKFETPQYSSLIPVTWNPEYPLPPPRGSRCWSVGTSRQAVNHLYIIIIITQMQTTTLLTTSRLFCILLWTLGKLWYRYTLRYSMYSCIIL